MASPNYTILFDAQVSGTALAGSAGDVLLSDATTGLYTLATSSARGTRKATGLALGTYQPLGVVGIQQVGQVDTVTAGLGAGAASWVRVSTAGRLERVTPSGTDDVVGWCETDGTFHAMFGILTAAIVNGGGGSYTPPTGTGFPHITSGAQDGAARAIDLTSGDTTGNLALARVTAPTGSGLAKVISGAWAAAGATLVNADVSASAAIAVSKLAPSGTNGWVLTTTGGVPVWAAPTGGSGSPGGSSGQMQFNNAGAFGGSDMSYASGTGYTIATNNTFLYGTDNGATTHSLIGIDSSNYFTLGGGLIQIGFGADDAIFGTVFGNIFRGSSAGVGFSVPVTGLNGPWGAVDGQTVVAVSTSNITLSAAQYATRVQKFTGAPAAARTITYPAPADDAHSYEKVIWGQQTVSQLAITTGTGTSVSIAVSSAPHTLLFTTTGVVQLT